MYNLPFILRFDRGTAVNNKTGERVRLSAENRKDMTMKFMDVASARGGSWTLFVNDFDILGADINEPGNACFRERFQNEVNDQPHGYTDEMARIMALLKLGLFPMDIGDIIETYYGTVVSEEMIGCCYEAKDIIFSGELKAALGKG